MYRIYIYIYICIERIYNTYELEKHKILLKSQIFLFSEALPMCNQIAKENTDNLAT